MARARVRPASPAFAATYALGYIERSHQIEGHDSLEQAGAHRGRGGVGCAAGVVDHHIEVAVVVHDHVDQAVHLLGVTHVARDERRCCNDFGRLVAPARHDEVAGLRECVHQASTETAGPSRHEDDTARIAQRIHLEIDSTTQAGCSRSSISTVISIVVWIPPGTSTASRTVAWARIRSPTTADPGKRMRPAP